MFMFYSSAAEGCKALISGFRVEERSLAVTTNTCWSSLSYNKFPAKCLIRNGSRTLRNDEAVPSEARAQWRNDTQRNLERFERIFGEFI